MNMYWKGTPFLRVLLPFMAGIVLYRTVPSGNIVLMMAIVMAIVVVIKGFRLLNDYNNIRFACFKGILIQSLLVLGAYLLCIFHSVSNSPSWYKSVSSKYEYMLVRINDEIQENPKTRKANVEMLQLIGRNKIVNVQGEAILYFQQGIASKQLKEGDLVLVKNKLKDIHTAGNPGEFDYASYCHLKNIFQTAFIKENEWKLSSMHTTSIGLIFRRAGQFTRKILGKHISNPLSLGIAEALLMGYRNDIDHEIWQAYSNTGIVHIIAISGMHMAMIYGSVRYLLLLMPFMRNKRAITLSLSILCMWLFAGMTGLPPSVTRAAIMFTFIGIGEIINRDISGLNNLSASAFCLLCINPNWLMDVGFQLSYLAVLSLLFFYKKVYDWVFISNKWLDAVWKLMAATIAAQILAFPLCIYYFHQFPILFLLTNLIAVPATTVILYAEILYVILSWITPLAKWIGFLISKGIEWLNQVVMMVGQGSFAVWSGLQVTQVELLMLYLFVLLFAVWLAQRKFVYLMSSLLILTGLLGLSVYSTIIHQQTRLFLVLNAPKQKAIVFSQGSQYFSPDQDSLIINPNLYQFVWKPALLALQLHNFNKVMTNTKKNEPLELYQFEQMLIARVKQHHFTVRQVIQLDCLILSESANPDAAWIMKNFQTRQIILDSSIPFWKIAALKDKLSDLHIPIHSVSEDGAFKVAL